MRTGRLSTNIKISLILFLLGVWAVPAPLATAQDDTLTGWFTFIVADYPSEDSLASETTYVLTEDSGERHELLIDIELMRPLGGPVALNRKRVTVEGEWEQSGAATEKFRVSSIELAVSLDESSALEALPDGASALHSTSQAAVTGSQAWVTILCRFGDATDVTPHPVSYYEDLMGSAEPQLGHYWNEVSYGNIPDLRGSRVVGWYNLPRPRSYYYYDRVEDGYIEPDHGKLKGDCIAAADADVFFPDFWGINLIFNGDIGIRGFGGSERLTLDGHTRFWGTSTITDGFSRNTVAHEMGHAFGLRHSSGPYERTYDSEWDVMSGGAPCTLPDYEYGCQEVHPIAYHKDFLGWIPSSRKYVAPRNSTRTITLERLAQPGTEGYLMAQIPIGRSRTDFYTVEARLFAGYDDEIPDEAVVIHKVDTTREDRLAQVVDIDNNGDPNDTGARWTVGEIFTDRKNTLQVSIDAADATSYRVTINTNPDTFSTCINFLSPPSLHAFGPEGGRGSIQVTAIDCDWSATSHAPWIRLTPGTGSGSGSVEYTVAANPSATARTGTFTIEGWTVTVHQLGPDERLFADALEHGTDPQSRGWGAPFYCTEEDILTCPENTWVLITDSSLGGTWSAILSPVIDLTTAKFATLTFRHRYGLASADAGGVSLAREEEEWNWHELVSLTGTQPGWERVSLDLTQYVGSRTRLIFELWINDATDTVDGWHIDDVAVYALDSGPSAPAPQARLENPAPNSFQSGIAAISGWACEAQNITIELNGVPYRAGYPTTRPDTQGVCGDTDNGFSLLWNWNNLGPGTHTVRALLDGQEFANTTVRVTTFGEQVLRGVSGTFPLSDFPHAGDTTRVQWAESLQNFVITDGSAPGGGGHASVAGVNARLENPSLGSAQSGIAAISGWACEAQTITIELNGVPYRAGYPTTRPDTQDRCGDTDNGFSLLWNWNNLGPGTHTVRALLDGQEFANTTVRVTTFGEQVLRGVSGTFPLSDFPHAGDTTRIRWEESLQNFVIIP